MIIFLGLASCILSAMLLTISSFGLWVLMLVMAGLGGMCLPIYGQCISHVNDHLLPRQFVASASALLLLNGAGAAGGPLLATLAMQVMGPEGFAALLAIAFGLIGGFGIYRSFVAKPVPLEDQGDTILMPARGSAVSIYTEDD
jgi:hypothetical protein